MRLLTLILIIGLYSPISYSQSLNLSQFTALCDGSPDIDIDDINDPTDNFEDISGITICGNNGLLVITIQQSGIIRYFDTWEYKNEAPIIGTLGLGNSQDYEGITYLFEEAGSHYYAACNEDESKIAVFSINYTNDNFTLNVNVNNGQPIYLSVKSNGNLIPISGNGGLEGISYNPDNGKIYTSKEKSPATLYETQNTYFSISDFVNASEITVTEVSTELDGVSGIDFAGLFHTSLGGSTNGQNTILLLSEASETVYLLNLSNQTANVIESFQLTGVHSVAKIEGVVFKNRTLIVCNDTDEGRPMEYSDFYSYVDKGPGGVLGDANCDGMFNVADAYWVARISVGLEVACDDIAGDMTLDGIINISDAYNIARCVVGLNAIGCPCKNN